MVSITSTASGSLKSTRGVWPRASRARQTWSPSAPSTVGVWSRPSSEVARTFQEPTGSSAAGETWWTALGQRARPLARVLAAQEHALREELHGEEGVLVDVAAEIDQALGEPDRERGVGRDYLRQPRGGRHVLARRHDL